MLKRQEAEIKILEHINAEFERCLNAELENRLDFVDLDFCPSIITIPTIERSIVNFTTKFDGKLIYS